MVRDGLCSCIFFFQAEDGIRDLVRSRGLGDVYKRQTKGSLERCRRAKTAPSQQTFKSPFGGGVVQ